MTTPTTTTTTLFKCIFRSIYIRQLIFNHTTTKRTSLKGRDIIKLPLLGMISIYAMPWHFVKHYLPKDRNQILPERRRRVITEYCCHSKATLDTFNHLLKWSNVEFDWEYLKRDGYCLTVRDEKILEYIVKKCPLNNYYFDWAMEQACKYGHLSIVKLICSSFKGLQLQPFQIKKIAMYTACSKGFTDIVKYLLENRTEQWGDAAIDRAATNNHLDIVKLLHFHKSRAIGCTKNAINFASEHGHLEVVKFLFEHRTERCNSYAIDEAAKNGYIEMVKYLHELGVRTTNYAMDSACHQGNLEIVKFLHFNCKGGATKNAMDWASMNGHIDIVRFLSEHRTEGSTNNAMDWAAENGNIEMVKYLHQHRSEGATTYAMDLAAKNGHIEIVQFLSEHRTEGCSQEALNYAARNGDIEMLSFLVDTVKIKCQLDTLKESLENGHLDTFHFIYNHISNNKKNDKILWTTEVMDLAAKNGHIEIVKFLSEHRTEGATNRAMDMAAGNGHFEVVKYLHFNRTEGATTYAMDYAAQNGHIEVFKFLHEHRTEGTTVMAMNRTVLFTKFLPFNENQECTDREELASFLINARKEKCDEGFLLNITTCGYYGIVKLALPHFVGPKGIVSIQRVLETNTSDHFEVRELLKIHLKELNKKQFIGFFQRIFGLETKD
ncbi:hypothetical protein DFA_04394 [Cavenderia fasciculata]|uniref:Ankyrin repeat-containing protein n=1 Tax=Cavenderia fasciculata TaxID=261658 RepID=F4PPG3_CACFS|nr:uncharacterized protein DFA_04394 [Cavenderia fasciculata]EGG22276.1 hypothetical protein DFA_04394 [Cavenderia fasciculata]|eukprot:XP_004360127.1 hypothetical protein DFA_04394 [Cavenderia fasciculata]